MTSPCSLSPGDGSVPARVNRVVRLGFEVRAEMSVEATGDDVWAQVTRERADELGLEKGTAVYLVARPDAVRIPLPHQRSPTL